MKRKGIVMRIGITVGIICLLIGISLILPATEARGRGRQEAYEGVLRFHVKANSDSVEDQQLKMAVKEEVFAKIEEGITKAIKESENFQAEGVSQEELRRKKTIEYIDENLRNIERWVKDCVEKKGFDYDVTAKVGVTPIPGKEYDGIYFPPGNYNALTITIGEGRGQNWWCVIFPPLCLVDCKDSEYKDAFGVDNEGRLVLKSKILEMLSNRNIKQDDAQADMEFADTGELAGALTGVKGRELSGGFCLKE